MRPGVLSTVVPSGTESTPRGRPEEPGLTPWFGVGERIARQGERFSSRFVARGHESTPHASADSSRPDMGRGWRSDRLSGAMIFVQIRRSGAWFESEIPSCPRSTKGTLELGPLRAQLKSAGLGEKGAPESLSDPQPRPKKRPGASRRQVFHFSGFPRNPRSP